MNKCKSCGKTLSPDEIGLYKKLFNRGAEEFMCMECQSAYLNVSKELLTEKIEQFKKMGCTLFV